MGNLFYGNTAEAIGMPDRLLAHVKVVAATKLRRGESFTLSWRHPAGADAGRTTIWMQPAIPLRFVFDASESEALEPTVLKRLAEGANSSQGLVLDLAEFEELPHLTLAAAAA
jgi:hypothetical protein